MISFSLHSETSKQRNKGIKIILIIKSVMIILKVFMNCNKYHSQLLQYLAFKGKKIKKRLINKTAF